MQAPHSSGSGGILLAYTAVACLIVMVFAVGVAAAVTPNYSHMSQFISELGATGAPYGWFMRFAGFLPAGLLLLAYCAIAHRRLPRSLTLTLSLIGLAIYAAGYLVAAVFPCDPGCRPPEPSISQIIHNVGGLAGYLLAPAFLFGLAHATRDWHGATRLRHAGYIASAISLLSMLTLSPDSPMVGLSQRALEASVLIWLVMLGLYATKASRARPRLFD